MFVINVIFDNDTVTQLDSEALAP